MCGSEDVRWSNQSTSTHIDVIVLIFLQNSRLPVELEIQI
jgi:hypothetical protein